MSENEREISPSRASKLRLHLGSNEVLYRTIGGELMKRMKTLEQPPALGGGVIHHPPLPRSSDLNVPVISKP